MDHIVRNAIARAQSQSKAKPKARAKAKTRTRAKKTTKKRTHSDEDLVNMLETNQAKIMVVCCTFL